MNGGDYPEPSCHVQPSPLPDKLGATLTILIMTLSVIRLYSWPVFVVLSWRWGIWTEYVPATLYSLACGDAELDSKFTKYYAVWILFIIDLFIYFISPCLQRSKSVWNDSLKEIYVVPVCIYNRNIRCPYVFLQQKYTLPLHVCTTKIYVVPMCIYNRNISCPYLFLQQKVTLCVSTTKLYVVPVCIYNRNIRCPYLFLQQKVTLCVSTTKIYVIPVCIYNRNIRCPCVYL